MTVLLQFTSLIFYSESESDIRPSMVTHTLNVCSAFNPSKVHIKSSKHTYTHTVNTHPEKWAAFYAAAPGEQLGVRWLAQGQVPFEVPVVSDNWICWSLFLDELEEFSLKPYQTTCGEVGAVWQYFQRFSDPETQLFSAILQLWPLESL